MKGRISKAELSGIISKLSESGIQADRNHLIEDIGAQFADHREWIREYVVNAFDAGATWCRVSGKQANDIITIVVDDNGHGMDEQGVKDFMTLFKSVKQGDPSTSIGRFGVGKASIIAIPNLLGFTLQSSTGKESWKLETGSLVDDSPVTIKQFAPPPPQGSRFGISFKVAKPNSLGEELRLLGDVLWRYVRYLPMSISVQEESFDSQNGGRAMNLRSINNDISSDGDIFTKRYPANIKGKEFQIFIGVGPQVHEIYQNSVLVTDRYNLVSYDLKGEKSKYSIPHLRIRVDSPAFELPFGRHCLRNEYVLKDVAAYIRERILPDYFEIISFEHKTNRLENKGLHISQVENIVCGLLLYMNQGPYSWITFPAFATTDGKKLSLEELRKAVDQTGEIFLEDGRNPGVDYSIFDSPVLASRQPTHGMKVLSQQFGEQLINLELEDVIIEKPGKCSQHLSDEEKVFQNQIGFHPSITSAEIRQAQENARKRFSHKDPINLIQQNSQEDSIGHQILKDLSETSKAARRELESITWRVNYLVERDGKTPCNSHKFLFKDNRVILNLNHSKVRQLLTLSKLKPQLAGHWSLAMCLSEQNRILPHLSADSREELIKLDALARTLSSDSAHKARERKQDQGAKKLLNSFMDKLDFRTK